MTRLIASPFEPDVPNVLRITVLAAATAPGTAYPQSSLSQEYKIATASPHKLTVTKSATNWVPKDSVNPVFLNSPFGCRLPYVGFERTQCIADN